MLRKLFNSPALLLMLAVLFWAGNFVTGRAIRDDIPPITLAFYRWFFATIVALFLARKHLRKDLPAILEKKWLIVLLSFTGITSFNTLVYLGLQSTVAINALLLQSILPVSIIGFSYILFRDPIRFGQLLGICISMVGVLFIAAQGDLEILIDLELNKGDILVFIAIILYAIYSVFLRKRPQVHPMSFISATFFIGTILLLPFYLFEFQSETPKLNLVTCSAFAYVAVFPSIISYLCFNRGVELIGANRAGSFLHLMPVFGSIMAIIFLGEQLYWFHAVGVLCIALGIKCATKKRD